MRNDTLFSDCKLAELEPRIIQLETNNVFLTQQIMEVLKHSNDFIGDICNSTQRTIQSLNDSVASDEHIEYKLFQSTHLVFQ